MLYHHGSLQDKNTTNNVFLSTYWVSICSGALVVGGCRGLLDWLYKHNFFQVLQFRRRKYELDTTSQQQQLGPVVFVFPQFHSWSLRCSYYLMIPTISHNALKHWWGGGCRADTHHHPGLQFQLPSVWLYEIVCVCCSSVLSVPAPAPAAPAPAPS